MSRKIIALLMLAVLAVASVGSAFADEQAAYREFIESGAYLLQIHNGNPEYEVMLADREKQYDAFAVHDLDGDGIRELFVCAIYGVEQIDVFSLDGDSIVHLGTMEEDNFFQTTLYYEGIPAVYTAMGGPAMDLDGYTIADGALVKTHIGHTRVDDEGMETIGLDMEVDDPNLEALLTGTFITGEDMGTYLIWLTSEDLNMPDAWETLFEAQ